MPADLAEKLRDAITKSGKSYLAIAKETGVPVSRVWDFMNGGDMRLTNASKIATHLGLELRRKG